MRVLLSQTEYIDSAKKWKLINKNKLMKLEWIFAVNL